MKITIEIEDGVATVTHSSGTTYTLRNLHVDLLTPPREVPSGDGYRKYEPGDTEEWVIKGQRWAG